MKIILATDFHLGYNHYGLDEREQDFYSQYDLLIEKIIEEKADVFIELGDIFDSSRPSPYAMKRFKDGLKKLNEEKIKTYGIVGNHTMVQRKNYLPIDFLFDDLKVLNGDFVVIDGVWIGGVSYHTKIKHKHMKQVIDDLYEKAKEYDKKILLLHQGLQEYINIGYEFGFKELGLNRFDIVFLGHIHKKSLMKYKDTIVHYVGSLNSCNVTELSDEMVNGKGYTVLDTETFELEMKTLPPVRHYFEFNLTNDEFNDEFINKTIESIKKYDNKPIVQLNVETNNSERIYEKKDLFRDYCISSNIKILPTKEEKKYIEENFPKGELPPVEVLLKKVVNEKYKDRGDWVGDFAVELMKRCSSGNKKGAMELTDEVYKEKFRSG